jgi:RHS repeat-associated protein
MQPALSTPITQPPILAIGQRGEKPHQGLRSKNPVPYRVRNRCNLRNALGLREAELRNRVRSRCSGEQYDPDLGLYYLRARYYNPVTGRFLNVDPMAGDGQRRYEYAAANPVNRADPSGRFVLESYWPLMAPLLIQIPFTPPSWCGYLPASLRSLFSWCSAPPAPKPPLPCNHKADLSKQYVLSVINDTGGTSKEMNDKARGESGAWDVRAVNYNLQFNASPAQMGTSAVFCTCAITEHQSASQLTKGSGTESGTGYFQDWIGPQANRDGSIVHSKRYFTVVLDGTNLGEVQVNDRFGEHSVDDIKIDTRADTTELNGTLKPTDIP